MKDSLNTPGTQETPALVLLDDSSISESLLEYALLRFGEIGIPIDAVYFERTDDAAEFIIDNASRVFMLIQDTFRDEGRIIPGWKALRATRTPPVGFRSICGDFSVFVMDAFAPEATQVFYGGSFSPSEQKFLETWGTVDRRIIYHEKGNPSLLFSDEKDLLAQWERWLDTRAEKDISKESGLLGLVAEEMAVICGARPDYLQRLTPRQFEELIAALFKNHGFTVHLTAQTRDGGYDIVAVNHSKLPQETTLVEVKHFAPHRPVGVGVVRALYGVKALHGASKGILATSSYVSKYARREFSRVIPWELDFKERRDIVDWCKSYLSDLLLRSQKDGNAGQDTAADAREEAQNQVASPDAITL